MIDAHVHISLIVSPAVSAFAACVVMATFGMQDSGYSRAPKSKMYTRHRVFVITSRNTSSDSFTAAHSPRNL